MAEGLGVPPEELLASLKVAESLLTDWVTAVQDVGTGWDDWDSAYKAAAYNGNLEAIRAVIAKAEQR